MIFLPYIGLVKYQHLQPPHYLKDYVRYFWAIESHVEDETPDNFTPAADGCPGLIFQQTGKGTFYQNSKQLPGIFLYGQATRPTELQVAAPLDIIGIIFYPHALKSIFGMDAQELTDSCTDLEALAVKDGYSLLEQMQRASGITQQVEVLATFLIWQIRKNNVRQDAAVQYALSAIINSKGLASLKDIQTYLQLSERSFERRFKQCIGLTPKLFSRICRFQASLAQLKANDYQKLSDIAFENEYADQSHFIRAFKEFAGYSPYQYQKQSNEIVKSFPELIK
jgi:AraC-like DNA-binding protein